MYNTASINVTLPVEMLAELIAESIKTEKSINELIYIAVQSMLVKAKEFEVNQNRLSKLNSAVSTRINNIKI